MEGGCSPHPPELPESRVEEDVLCETVGKANGEKPVLLHTEGRSKDYTVEEEEEEGAPSLSDEERESDPLSVCFADEDIPTRVRQHQTHNTHAVHSPLNRDFPLKLTKDDIITHLSKLQRDVDSEKKLDQLFMSLTTLTAQEDMLRTLRWVCTCSGHTA